jgi:hypothetical protein
VCRTRSPSPALAGEHLAAVVEGNQNRVRSAEHLDRVLALSDPLNIARLVKPAEPVDSLNAAE